MAKKGLCMNKGLEGGMKEKGDERRYEKRFIARDGGGGMA